MIKLNYVTKIKIFEFLKNIFKFFNLHLFYYKEKNYFEYIKVDNIIDVGVAYGTDFLLNNYQKSKFFLIEPNPFFFEFIEREILNKYESRLYKIAAGNEIGKRKFWFSEGFSSFIQREDYKLKEQIEVKIDKLDNILKNEKLSGKTLLKIDTEGYELEVLKGAEYILKITDYVVLEVRLENVKTYNPSEIITFLLNKNFYFYKILKVNYYRDGISYLDVIFKKYKKISN